MIDPKLKRALGQSAKAVEVVETDNTIAVEVITASNFLFIDLHFFKYFCT